MRRKLVGVRGFTISSSSSTGPGPGEGEKSSQSRRTFLTLEEAGLVEMSGLSTHERFLCRLTISSLNLLRVISEQEECSIEELNAGKICDWFVKDRLKREQNLDTAVLQWDDSEFQL
ncbi:receptor-interacting protein [Trema orientale]|uniref:Receptor-interacting protein n=1 Tax=Trema orientale TaxID=63057 RepID=A0A2P5EJQ0_TREOI|nr:receptor-interacting protein [Trema orientale]